MEAKDTFVRLMRGPTGYDERLVPEAADPGNLAQHVVRYEFALPICAGKVVLDAGSGVGYGADMVGGVAERVYAMDYDPKPVKYSRHRYKSNRVHFLAGDVMHLPLKDNSADVVLSFEVLEHVPDHQRTLAESCRVLKRDGVLVISTPNRETAQLFRQKAGFTFDAHVSEVGLASFRAELHQFFADYRIWGMRSKGSLLYGFLRALDPWNLRLRLFSRRGMYFARETVFRVPSQGVTRDHVVISKRQLRQANHFLAVCTRKRV